MSATIITTSCVFQLISLVIPLFPILMCFHDLLTTHLNNSVVDTLAQKALLKSNISNSAAFCTASSFTVNNLLLWMYLMSIFMIYKSGFVCLYGCAWKCDLLDFVDYWIKFIRNCTLQTIDLWNISAINTGWRNLPHSIMKFLHVRDVISRGLPPHLRFEWEWEGRPPLFSSHLRFFHFPDPRSFVQAFGPAMNELTSIQHKLCTPWTLSKLVIRIRMPTNIYIIKWDQLLAIQYGESF